MSWEIVGGVFAASLVGGIVPAVCTEVIVAASLVAAPGHAAAIVGAATAGQMIAKIGLYALARWAPERLPARARGALGRARGMVASRDGATGSLVLASAGLGVPPFFLVSLASGALHVRLSTFVFSGTAGRAGRFVAIALLARAGTLTFGG